MVSVRDSSFVVAPRKYLSFAFRTTATNSPGSPCKASDQSQSASKSRKNWKVTAVSLYNTPYGILDLNVDTKKLKINIDENGGEVHSKYVLGLEGQEGISTELSIKIKVN